jgi:hypothetical protein
MKIIASPYEGLSSDRWKRKTVELIKRHPLVPAEIVEVTLSVWADIFRSGIGAKPFRIGVDLFPKPQIMGFFLHELIPLELARRYPGVWRGDESAGDKDLVYVSDVAYSVEIKTSSHKTRIFGNRSYAQEPTPGKKSKSGYCLAVNFEKCVRKPRKRAEILRIRFGWLDAKDWRGQQAPTGQQASLAPDVETSKLLALFPESEL